MDNCQLSIVNCLRRGTIYDARMPQRGVILRRGGRRDGTLRWNNDFSLQCVRIFIGDNKSHQTITPTHLSFSLI